MRTELNALSRFSTAPRQTLPGAILLSTELAPLGSPAPLGPLASRLSPDKSSAPADDLSALEDTATEAAEKQIIAPVPDARAAFESSPEHILGIRKILHLLGYLADNNQSPELSPELRAAIRLFQTEAGLTVDGWVGPETCRVINNLYHFETESDIPRWAENPAYEKLLHRATQRRLNALGFEPTLPHTALVDLTPALEKFRAVAEELNLLPHRSAGLPSGPPTIGPAPAGPDSTFDLKTFDFRQQQRLLPLLFDHDGLVARLGTHASGLGFTERQRRARLGPFLVNLLKIELWLLHYNVVPDGDGSWDLSALTATHGGPRRGFSRPTAPLPAAYLALREFWQDHLKINRTDPAAFLDPGQFLGNYPAFFREFAALSTSGDAASRDDVWAQRIATEIEADPAAYEKTWFDRVREIGGVLWDGIKRAWGWLRRFFDTVVDKVKNLVRAAYHLAAETFAALRCAISSFPATVDLLFSSTAPGSNARTIIFTHDRDSDYTSWLNPLATNEALQTCNLTLRRHTAAFGFCTRVLGLVLEGLRAAVSTGLTNWLALVRTLLRLRSALADCITYWREHRELLLALVAK